MAPSVPFLHSRAWLPYQRLRMPCLQSGKTEAWKSTSSDNDLMFSPSLQRNGYTGETRGAPGTFRFPAPSNSTAQDGRCVEGPPLLRMGGALKH